ncbi:phenylalanine--tRNA ligase subunit beta [Dehalococcoidia bacterium]|nr:phenylalanine--tRNA ligase subunit beta [Dehalococcoidia bacterium]
MKVSLKWLQDYVDITLSPKELAHRLTMAGIETGGIQTIGDGWDNVFVGEVVNLGKHPNADRLQLATVSLGEERHTVVCGAPNIRVGSRVPFARLGAKLHDGRSGKLAELKPAKIRGVLSEGMVCSEKELGISDNHDEIIVLPEEAPLGAPLAQYLGDTILDVSVTPNRPDCLSMIGIAREVAALTGSEIRLPKVYYEEWEPSTDEMISVEIVDPDLCPRYCAGIIREVEIGHSPHWMQKRLLAAGMRPINNIVDITNFVMLEYGQPLHAFDYEGIGGKRIIVRRAGDGEKLVTIDGEERELSPGTLVIANEKYPMAVAGVMGGSESEVTERTTTILLESANFNNASIRRTSFGLGLVSEASSRFDKSLSPDLPMPAIHRAIGLMVELAGGKAVRGIVDVYPGFAGQSEPVLLTERRANQVLGVDFGIARMQQTLESLGFECAQKSSSELSVSIPYWRTDVKIADDLVEEVARIIGYDEIPTTMLSGELPHHEPAPLASLRDRIRDIMVGCGMQEIINYSLTSQDVLDRTGYSGETPIRVANPLSQEQEFLRPTLRGGLLRALAANARHQEKGIMLFEIGKIYLPREGDLPEEREMLAGVIGGARYGRSWLADEGSFDFYYAKGVLETLFHHLGIEASFEAAEDELLFPGRIASILLNRSVIGIIGELHPDVAVGFDISLSPVCLFEIEVEKVLPLAQQSHVFRPIPRFPTTDRDVALLVEANLPARRIEDIIRGFPQVSQVSVFDLYQGEQVPDGKKSLAFSLRYQALDRTLTDEEVDKIQQKILTKLQKELGVVRRIPV